MKSLDDIINADDSLPGKTQINFEKAQQFKEACEILDRLKAKGILTYEADDPRESISYHTIQVKFNFDGEPIVTEASEISELLSKVDRLLIDDDSITGEWQLGSRIWTMKD